jgi:Icc-related predicted phosphoesterase
LRIHILSDLHREFRRDDEILPAKLPRADVVVLAGDIDVGKRGLEWARRRFESRILYVPGNHEFYDRDWRTTREEIRRAAAVLGIDLLDPNSVQIGDIVFIGATLWTDFRLFGDPAREMLTARKALNDFRLIHGFSPAKSVSEHERDRTFIESTLHLNRDKRSVVVTHHAPSLRSVAPRYRGDRLSAAFASNLEPLIAKYRPALWIHGHMHDSLDYAFGDTRVICNSYGYHDEEVNSAFAASLMIEL